MGRPILEQSPDLRATVTRPGGEVVHSDLHPLVDPRWGDADDDAASPKRRSLLSIAGNLLVEISLTKFLVAGIVLVLLPAVLIGFAPLVTTAWVTMVSQHVLQLTELGASLTAIVLIALAAIAWRPLLRIAEVNFWSLNALAVQPAYAFCRETLRHVAERLLGQASTPVKRARLRAAASAAAGILLCGCAILIAALVWPATQLPGRGSLPIRVGVARIQTVEHGGHGFQ